MLLIGFEHSDHKFMLFIVKVQYIKQQELVTSEQFEVLHFY